MLPLIWQLVCSPQSFRVRGAWLHPLCWTGSTPIHRCKLTFPGCLHLPWGPEPVVIPGRWERMFLGRLKDPGLQEHFLEIRHML